MVGIIKKKTEETISRQKNVGGTSGQRTLGRKKRQSLQADAEEASWAIQR